MKNNYSKLRQQKNSLQNRLNISSKTIKLKSYEIKRLLNVLELEQKANYVLENRLNLEIEQKEIAYKKANEINKQKDEYHEWYLKEIEIKNVMENKLIIGLTIAVIAIVALTTIIFKG